ncbi:hypothetical protein [Burkholderia gladioli]|uniref:hypothetical protein n=1 Tax=Burkholderia gladioli TaxID=28095 RepID=UPI001C262FBE|nr:hypothetical protein [Burkholderia gladioli]MBU9378716.1 hypothetical protein [Burkholderia gladioli]
MNCESGDRAVVARQPRAATPWARAVAPSLVGEVVQVTTLLPGGCWRLETPIPVPFLIFATPAGLHLTGADARVTAIEDAALEPIRDHQLEAKP